MIDWLANEPETKKNLIERFAEDRKELLACLSLRSAHYEKLLPSEVVEDVLLDVCGFHVVDEPLSRGQLALCDFGNRVVIVNSFKAEVVSTLKK